MRSVSILSNLLLCIVVRLILQFHFINPVPFPHLTTNDLGNLWNSKSCFSFLSFTVSGMMLQIIMAGSLNAASRNAIPHCGHDLLHFQLERLCLLSHRYLQPRRPGSGGGWWGPNRSFRFRCWGFDLNFPGQLCCSLAPGHQVPDVDTFARTATPPPDDEVPLDTVCDVSKCISSDGNS